MAPRKRHSAAVCRTSRSTRLAVLASTIALSGGVGLIHSSQPSWGQAAQPRAAAPTGAGAVAQAGGTGLDALKDDAVIAKLAAYGQESLANRLAGSMGLNRDQVAGMKVLRSLEELAQTPLDKLSNARRQTLLRQVVEGLASVLPSLKDANTLMTYTAALIQKGIEPDVNTIEYWGENPAAQAQLKPAVESARTLLGKVAEEADAEMKRIEGAIRGPSDPAGDRWLKLEQTKSTSAYVQNMIAYYLALATDGSKPEGQAERKKVADEAIKYFKDNELDKPDSGVMPLVLSRLGKLHMVKGEYAKAREHFGQLAKADPNIVPPPNPGQVFDAKFFGVLTDVLDKKPDDAAKGLAELEGWVKANIPADQQQGVEAALMLAKFRIASAQTDLAKDPAQKKVFDQQASDLLTQLYDKFPAYRGIITEQLVGRLGDNPDFTKQSPPVLWAVVAKGNAERLKPEGQPVDKKVVQRAIAAAKELAGRKEGVDAQRKEDAGLLVALFNERLGDNVAAGNGYIDFANTFKRTNLEKAGQAVDRAVILGFQAKKAAPDDGNAKDLYGRALGTAVGEPFRRKPAYYFYAQWLASQGKPKEAVPFFKAVPKDDPNALNARFATLVAMNNQVSEEANMDPKVRAQMLAEMGPLVDEVRTLVQAQLPASKSPESLKFRLAYATMLGADLAIRQKQAPRALQLLEGFENQIAGTSTAAALGQEASRVRVNAYLATNQLDKAQAEVQKLAASDPKGSAFLVSEVLKRLDKDYEAAEKAGDTQAMEQISAGQAGLTGVLANWAASSTEPEIKKLALDYKVYDANMKRRAGTRQKDPELKAKFIRDALAQYAAVREAAKQPGNALSAGTDSTVAFNTGLAHYDLGEFDKARDALGTLIFAGKLGGPFLDASEGGETRLKENEAYWEAHYKWLRSREAAAKADPGNATLAKDLGAAKNTLRSLFITNNTRTGGQKWAAEFDALRKEWIPDWVPGTAAATQPSTQPTADPATPPPPPADAPPPATQPVAAGTAR